MLTTTVAVALKFLALGGKLLFSAVLTEAVRAVFSGGRRGR